MKQRKNLILLDSAPQKEWNFKDFFEKYTKEKWEIRHIDSHIQDSSLAKKIKFFWFPAKLFVHRKEIGNILSFQQFYGLIFAWYCSLFHVKKRNKLMVATFIYRPKKGITGKIYFRFIKYLTNSQYIDKIICFSKSEAAYYEKLFHTVSGRFQYVPYAMGDALESISFEAEEKQFFVLAPGKSNRDYDFLVDSLKDTAYQVRILSDTYSREETGENIQIFHDVFGKDYLKMLSQCHCVVVPLEDTHISAGQLVFLQAMMFGKPVVVTQSDTVGDYIIDRKNGFVIKKDKNELLRALNILYEKKETYQKLSENARQSYLENHGLEKMAERIGMIYSLIKKRSSEIESKK